MKRIFISAAIIAMISGFSVQAYADLELRGEGSSFYGSHRLIYDTDRDITWYDYTQYYPEWGGMMSWAAGLEVNSGGVNYTDWRLPSALNQDGSGPCNGADCTGSEMGHRFYTELGNVAASDEAGWDYQLKNAGPFQDLQSAYVWSDTEHSKDYSWHFDTFFGFQSPHGKNGKAYFGALAVRPGDVAVAVAPEPVSAILFGVGGVVLAVRRKLARWCK